MQLYSREISLAPGTTARVLGDPMRSLIMVQVAGEQTFDMALVPRGVDPVDAWIDQWEAQEAQTFPHSGDVYLKDTDNAGDEIVRFISDTPIVVETL